MNLFSKNNIIGISIIIVAIIACLPYFYYCKNAYFVTVTYDNEKISLFEHDYNCGLLPSRLTERCLEIAIAKIWINKTKKTHKKIIEIGAVTPYYFDKIDDICDPSDPHEKVNIKSSMFNLDLRNKNVLSISTIEHIGLGQYDVPVKKGETAVTALNKILSESKTCFVTFPVGYNKSLDDYVLCSDFFKRFPKIKVNFYLRNTKDNVFSEEKDYNVVKKIPYGPNWANAVVLIEKK